MFGDKQKEIDRLTEENENFRRVMIQADILARQKQDCAIALNQENADLAYRLELYESVLASLRIPVTLPARKK
jgi:hypothetical protein